MNLKKQQISLPCTLFTLRCEDGFSVTLSTLGASIRRILAPFPDGSLRDLALSFASDDAYLGNGLYAGATLAPAAGRISHGQLPLPDGSHLSLARNENGTHTLHGGFHSASFQSWQIDSENCTKKEAQVCFRLILPDGLDGFPGERLLIASYTLSEDHTLSIFYTAISNKDTYFNVSNHAYFNLSGDFTRSALEQKLCIQSEQVIINRPDFIPQSVVPVTDTPFDFRVPISLSQQKNQFASDNQLTLNQGWNHGFILNREAKDPALICSCPESPLCMEVTSDAPCMVLYSGGYIPDGLLLNNGITASGKEETALSSPSCALAFEFQDYPDAPGGHGFPFRLTKAGALWQRSIRLAFPYL